MAKVVQKRENEMIEFEARKKGNVRDQGHIDAQKRWQDEYDKLRENAGLKAFHPVTKKPDQKRPPGC